MLLRVRAHAVRAVDPDRVRTIERGANAVEVLGDGSEIIVARVVVAAK